MQETRQPSEHVVPGVAITMPVLAKRGEDMEKQWDMYFERLSGEPEADLAGLKGLLPFDGLQYPPQIGTSEIQQVSSGRPSKSPSLDSHLLPPELMKSPMILDDYVVRPEPSKSPSLDRHVLLPGWQPELLKSPVILDDYVPVVRPELPKSLSLDNHVLPPKLLKSSILDHYMVPQELPKSPSLDDHVLPPKLLKSPILDQYMVPQELPKSPSSDHYAAVSTASESDPSWRVASESGQWTTSSTVKKPKSLLSKVTSKFRPWRRISGSGFIRDAVNAARRELQNLADAGAYVSASSPESQTF